MYPARHIALAAISAACKQHGYAVSLESDGSGCVPAMTTQELAGASVDLGPACFVCIAMSPVCKGLTWDSVCGSWASMFFAVKYEAYLQRADIRQRLWTLDQHVLLTSGNFRLHCTQ